MGYLVNHQVFASQDLHQARELLFDLNNIETLDVVGKNSEVDIAIHSAELGETALLYASFGTRRIQIETSSIDDEDLFFFFPTSGSAQVKHGQHECTVSTDCGLIRNMQLPLSAIEENFSILGMQLPVSKLRRHAHSLWGLDVARGDLVFDPMMDLARPETQHVRNTLEYVTNALDGPLRHLTSQHLRRELEDLLLTNILTMLPNSYADRLKDRPSSTAMPYYVKRARDYIHDHADEPIGLDDLVAYAGCSYRTLQRAFGDVLDMAPMAYAKQVRLSRAHDDLLMAGDEDTVATIARKWGFDHVGRFARIYAGQYGVTPSEALRRRN
ncbi:MAG: AraC family transcriptional regulator [Thalassospira sp.]|uniref:AraC family transcriptional regulator n=1 Tax=Thalassospira sp. TaxID=1912094 RepID=UPI0032F01BBE